MNMSFPTDSDGYLSQECPSCKQQFKVCFGEGSEEPISFCPYCGHKGHDCWYTQEQAEHIQAVTFDVVLGPELKKLEQTMKANLPQAGTSPMETDDALLLLRFPCCNETIKVAQHDKHFCIICGKEIEMASTNAKKVFLSHKGADKDKVRDFKETLQLLGYDPWLDEDAMTAGTLAERAILQGMKESCAVVFFITPSFKDENYLATEIDYAIHEKRAKEDKFAIITLRFVNAEGKTGAVPDLLTRYVWKTPKTSLEALREIVRALPVEIGQVDWRDGIDGVVQLPKVKSVSEELSEEAKAILLAAAQSKDGQIYISTKGGCYARERKEIFVNDKKLIPNDNPRVEAQWIGGIEELQRRRYIRETDHKGQFFQVTKEGYEAADSLRAA
ncbi:MAG: toll/interleukin-1 receptor domain-containing protein [Candidatus Electronema sp. V4]|uniref:toll/interleukin-1 receptor domain-containing protein n=1 Tax=Candidatus Electronema sp. V4 TaxID=3454756 RepID=UPI0040553C27